MKKYINWLGGAYILLLVVVITFLYIKYGSLYHAGRPGDYDEFHSVFVKYRNLLAFSGTMLTIYLGTWASGYGFIQNALWKGGLVFGLGILITGASFSVLPWLLYPNDQYSPGAIFVFSGMIPGIFCFLCVSFLLYAIRKSRVLFTFS